MKKICFFSGDITRNGGTERVSSMIANALAKQQNYTILFLSLVEQEQKPFFLLHKTIKHYALGKKWINPGPGYLKIIPLLRHFLKEKEIRSVLKKWNLVGKEILKAGEHRHIFSHMEWEMVGVKVSVEKENEAFIWARKEEILEKYAIPGAFSRFCRQI